MSILMPSFIIITFHRAPFHYLSATSARRYFKIERSIEMCENDYLYYDNRANLHTCICQACYSLNLAIMPLRVGYAIECAVLILSAQLGRLRETDQYGS